MLIAMKKATLFALKEDRDAILLALQKDGNIMLISEGDKTQTLEGADKVGDQIAKAKDALKFPGFRFPTTPSSMNRRKARNWRTR